MELQALTLSEVLGLFGGLEGVVLYGNDEIFPVVQILGDQSAHEVDQSVRVTQEHVNCTHHIV